MASRPASTPVPRVSPRAASASTAPPPPTGDVARHDAGLKQVRAELGDCQRCRLSKERKNIVYGVGNPQADLVLIGEAPGKDEDLTGEPFVGRSGQLLTRMLAAIGFERDQVYICNVIKCRPPQNRDPLSDEIATCSPFLHRQVAAIAPKAILTLGRFAAMNLVGEDLPMGELRKRLGSLNGTPVVPTYHPSYLLRSPAMKRLAWEDLLRVRQLLRDAKSLT
jgi:DNA polymerase